MFFDYIARIPRPGPISFLTRAPVHLRALAAPPSEPASAVSPPPMDSTISTLISDFQRRHACLRFVKDSQALVIATLHLASERGASPPLYSFSSRLQSGCPICPDLAYAIESHCIARLKRNCTLTCTSLVCFVSFSRVRQLSSRASLVSRCPVRTTCDIELS